MAVKKAEVTLRYLVWECLGPITVYYDEDEGDDPIEVALETANNNDLWRDAEHHDGGDSDHSVQEVQ